jgi:hypothetical protein
MILGKHAIGTVSLGDTEWLAGVLSSDEAQFTITADGTTLEIIPNLKLYWLRPGFVIPGYSSDGTNITLPIASLIGLSAAEADAITGDWREILQAILLRAVEYHKTWVWSDQPRTYNPFGMNLLNSRTFDRHFGITFYVDMGEANVAQEP